MYVHGMHVCVVLYCGWVSVYGDNRYFSWLHPTLHTLKDKVSQLNTKVTHWASLDSQLVSVSRMLGLQEGFQTAHLPFTWVLGPKLWSVHLWRLYQLRYCLRSKIKLSLSRKEGKKPLWSVNRKNLQHNKVISTRRRGGGNWDASKGFRLMKEITEAEF